MDIALSVGKCQELATVTMYIDLTSRKYISWEKHKTQLKLTVYWIFLSGWATVKLQGHLHHMY